MSSRYEGKPNDETVDDILNVVIADGSAVVGRLEEDGFELWVDFVAGPTDLTEFQSELEPGQPVFFGAFPGRDNDGRNAVTLTVPDRDGVVRGHPH